MSFDRFVVLSLLAVLGCQPGAMPVTAPSNSTDKTPAEVQAMCVAPNEPLEKRARPKARTQSEPENPDDLCEVAQLNVEHAIQHIVGEGASAGPMLKSSSWDKKSKPKHLDLVTSRYALDASEVARLRTDGFMVLSRLHHDRYDAAYHDIYRSQLPVYITVDSVMHAVFASHDEILASLETGLARPLLSKILFTLHCELPAWSKRWPEEVRHDVDVHLAVARRLLGEKLATNSSSTEVEALVAQAEAGTGVKTLALYGRPRTVDFTFFTPRGHYTGSESLKRYFRTISWLTRIETNLVSRGGRSSGPTIDTTETPREAVVALALSELAEQAHMLDDIGAFEGFLRAFVGPGETVSLHDLSRIRHETEIEVGDRSIDDTAAALRKAIGTGFRRTVATHWQPREEPSELPAIGSFLPLGIVKDAKALARLGHPHVLHRYAIGAGDVGFVLGHDRAKKYLEPDLARHPSLGTALTEARTAIASDEGSSLHDSWLHAIRSLGEKPKGVVPSFFATDAHRDLRLSSALAGYGQLRHAHVLLAAQPVYGVGCEIPDGWVEPAPSTYDALIAYATRGEATVRVLDAADTTGAGAYFARLARILGVLRTIQRHELEGRALTTSEKRFLAMVAEIGAGDYNGTPRTAGWYFDLYEHPSTARRPAAFIADYATGDVVSYLGVSGVRIGLFVVDVGGVPRVMAGPIAATYETATAPIEARLDDQASTKLPDTARSATWNASHVLPTPVPLPLETTLDAVESKSPGGLDCVVTLRSKKDLGNATIELLDHHLQPMKRFPHHVAPGETKVTLATGSWERIRVVVGATRIELGTCEGN